MRPRLKWATVYRFYEWLEPWLNQSVPKEVKPSGAKVVVLAPHIDDETIGCGGVTMKHTAAGDRVAILTFVDCTPARIAEGTAAGKILGVQRHEFLPFQSADLMTQPAAAARMGEFLKEEAPDLIYLPSVLDRQRDHVALNVLLARQTQALGLSAMVYGYEVWSTLTPNVAVDITAEQPRKAAALACFTSQNATNNWLDAALALNRYRGVTTGAGLYAEAFHRLTTAGHCALVARLGWKP